MQKRLRSGALLAAILATSAISYACANPNQPPGGPPDSAPPRVTKILPISGTVGAKPKAVVIQFDEVISETPKGAADLRALVFISPRTDADVDWRRSQIDVKPKGGWKPNTVYSVLLGAGVQDLRNNSIDTATRIVFSTGGVIPETKITGVAFDWQAARFAPKAIVEAISKDNQIGLPKSVVKDSVIYQTIADTLGRYSLEHLPAGNYTLRAFVDRNNNRSLEPLEAWDTVAITITSTGNADFHAFTHDTTGLHISSGGVVVLDSGKTIRITFDKPVSPGQAFPATQIVVKKVVKSDSTVVNVANIFTAPMRQLFDSLQRKAREDSILKKQPPPDTSAAARASRDSVARKKLRDSLNKIEQDKITERRLLALRGGKPLPPKDTTPQPKMKRAPLYNDVFVIMEKPLDWEGTYSVEVRNVRSVSGTLKTLKPYGFKAPPKPKPPEEKKAPGDTAAPTTVPIKR